MTRGERVGFKTVEAARFFGAELLWVVETSKGLIHAVAFDTRFFTVLHTLVARRSLDGVCLREKKRVCCAT